MVDTKFIVKNGLRTQNISFVDDIGTPTNTITAEILNNNNLSFSGSNGQIIKIIDNSSGTIFSVNDISGIPSIEVDKNGTIKLSETSGNVLIGTNIDDGTNKLQVDGNIALTGALNADGSIGTTGQILISDGIKTYWGDAEGLGYTGSQGDIGYTGSKGDIGYTGSKGSKGDTGFTGSKGDDGTLAETSDTAPTPAVDGQLWFNTNDATLKVYYDDGTSQQWITTSGPVGPQGDVGYTGSAGVGFTGSKGDTGSAGSDGVNGTTAETSDTAPTPAVDGQLWFDTTDSTLNVYYDDGTSQQWITTSGPAGPQGDTGYTGSAGVGFTGSKGDTGTTGTLAETSDTAPTPAVDGQLWFDTTDSTLNVYYDDGTSQQWITTSGPAGPQGDTGYTGSAGDTGFTGSKGNTGTTGTLAETSDTAPTPAVDGQLWFDTTDSTLNVYYDDGTSQQWITTSGPEGPAGQDVEVYAADTPPTNPSERSLWFNTNDASMYFYLIDEDSSQWVAISGPTGPVGYTGSVGTGDVISSAAIFTGSIQEQVYQLTDAATITIEPANGSMQYLTSLGSSRTIDVTNFVDGETVALMINDNSGSGSVTTWTTVEWVNNGGVAPAWPDSGNYTVISLWKVAGTVYGALVGDGS